MNDRNGKLYFSWRHTNGHNEFRNEGNTMWQPHLTSTPHLGPCRRGAARCDKIILDIYFCPGAGTLLIQSPTMHPDPAVLELRKILTNENAALAKRFRALFSLKHLAAQAPSTSLTVPAIEAIAAAFTSPSALLKHELAYCLGQSGKEEAVPFLRQVVEDRQEDAMCRHEAAEALGALGDRGSLDLLERRRDDPEEEEVVRETCDIAVERIEWEHSEARGAEKLKRR